MGYCDIKSRSGNIKFYSQEDNQPEMTLNSTGLGIGISPTSNLHINGNAIISDQLFIGGNSGSSNLNVNGTIGYSIEMVNASKAISGNSYILVDSSTGNITLSLPEASSVTGRKYTIKKISHLNNVYVRGGGFIDNYSEISLKSDERGDFTIISYSGNWHMMNLSGNGSLIGSDNLIGWWKLDELNGTSAVDSSSFGNNGSLVGDATFSANRTEGVIDRAFMLDGNSGNYLSAASDTSLDDWNRFTVTVWVKPLGDSEGAYSAILGTGLSGVNSFGIYTNKSPSNFVIRIGGSLNISGSLTIGEWNHIACTWDGSNVYTYTNGLLTSSDTWSGTLSALTKDFEIGKIFDRSQYFWNGQIDDVRLYNRVLDVSKIQVFYNQRE